MTKEKKNLAVMEFVSFCIERYKQALGLPGREAAELFKSLGVIQYLIANYEILHTQSADFIQEEIMLFINSRKK